MSTITLEVTAKSKTGKGIVGKDKIWYNTGKNVSFADIQKGDVVELEFNGTSGVNFVSKVVKQGGAAKAGVPSPVPSLPTTTIADTKAPGGTAPVTPAKKRTEPTVGDPDKMSKQDWLNKDINIERVAVIKSVLQSPAYAQLVVGKRIEDALSIGSSLVDHFIQKLDSLKGK